MVVSLFGDLLGWRKLNLDLGQMEELKVTLLSQVSFHQCLTGGQGEEGLVGAALASVKLGWRCGRKGGWGGTRKPQTTLMWVDEFRPDLVVMLLCSLHQDHSWSPCGFEKV